jgi:ABC-2 type transport system permease protein
MLKYLIEKEFKQTVRNPIIPRLLVMFPIAVVMIFPWAVNHEISNINVCMVDRDRSSFSQRLTTKIAASDYFNLVAVLGNNEEALQLVEDGKADVILDIEPEFEKNLMKQGEAGVMISANAVNQMKGGLSSGYMTAIVRDFAEELREELLQPAGKSLVLPVIQVIPQARFNVFLDYKVFMIPALIVMVLTLICGFLPALNIVNEKEIGTIEQINVTPIGKFSFVMAKLIPYWIIGLLIFTLFIALSALVYGLIPRGNLLTIYFSTLIYILVVSGIGLVISNHSSTLQQAMFVMFFFIIILILISGLFTPIASMPHWAQVISDFNPLRYFIEIMRMVYLKGSDITNLFHQLTILSIFAVVFNGWAIISYRKSK